jgi:glycosyltransferase involved in cell wall biosynthesis
MGTTAGDSAADLPWTEGSVRIVGCGSVAPWKGPEQWLAAAEEVSVTGGRKVEWMWVGSGVQLSTLRDETRRRGLDDRVHWIGEREDVAPYLASADLFVLTSENEPLGLVLLEAAAVGVASVAFRTGGVPEILVDDRALVRPGDLGELVEKIRAVLGSQVLAAELLDASRPALDEGDPTVWRTHLAHALESVLHRRPPVGDAP